MQHWSVKDSYTVKLYIVWILEFGYRMLNLNDTRFLFDFTYHLEDAKGFSAGKPSICYIQLLIQFDEFLRKLN